MEVGNRDEQLSQGGGIGNDVVVTAPSQMRKDQLLHELTNFHLRTEDFQQKNKADLLNLPKECRLTARSNSQHRTFNEAVVEAESSGNDEFTHSGDRREARAIDVHQQLMTGTMSDMVVPKWSSSSDESYDQGDEEMEGEEGE